MCNQIKIIKATAQELAETRSEKFIDLYFDFIKIINNHFDNQSEEYIKSLDNYNIIKKESFSEIIISKLSELFQLGQQEAEDKINNQLGDDGFSLEIPNTFEIEFVKEHGAELITGINETTEKTINKIITDGVSNGLSQKDIAKNIKEKFSDFSLYRSSLIAQMETSIAYGEGEQTQYKEYSKELGVEGWKRAKTQNDDNVTPSHLDNQKAGWIKMDEAYPGTGTMKAPHGFNCRCSDDYSLVNPN